MSQNYDEMTIEELEQASVALKRQQEAAVEAIRAERKLIAAARDRLIEAQAAEDVVKAMSRNGIIITPGAAVTLMRDSYRIKGERRAAAEAAAREAAVGADA